MNNWKISKAKVIGRQHEIMKINCHDFCDYIKTENRIVGIVCDGCGEGEYSEIGATILGKFILNKLISFDSEILNENVLKTVLETFIEKFIDDFIVSLGILDIKEKVLFIKNHLLTTIIFCIIENDRVIIGNAGDGIIIVNSKTQIIEQENKPQYISYNNIPKVFLASNRSTLKGLEIKYIDNKNINTIIIGTDGIKEIIDSNLIHELYANEKRELQRKFNVYSKNKIFSDDASCIVFETYIDQQIFSEITEKWRKDILFLSSITKMAELESYKKIVNMGKKAIPFIMQDIETNGSDHWDSILTEILKDENNT